MKLDAAGALWTAAVTAALPSLIVPLGVPSAWIYGLATVALGFAMFSFISALAPAHRQAGRLRTIAIANAAYAGATLLLTVLNARSLHRYAVVYFATEIVVLLLLARIEWRASARQG